MYYLSFFLILLMGLVLGLTGGGGSILTVPILKYGFDLPTQTAITYSLFLVGSTSFFGTLIYIYKKQVDIKTGLIFSLPSIFGVVLTRRFLLPSLPESLLALAGFELTKDGLVLALFIAVMLFSSYRMITGGSKPSTNPEANQAVNSADNNSKNSQFLPLLIKSFLVGILTGLIGAGGGFVIVPVLVLVFKLKIKQAIATSLFVITLNSLIGFISSPAQGEVDWRFLLILLVLSFLGNLLGILLQKHTPSKALKKGFGYFVLAIAVFMIFNF